MAVLFIVPKHSRKPQVDSVSVDDLYSTLSQFLLRQRWLPTTQHTALCVRFLAGRCIG